MFPAQQEINLPLSLELLAKQAVEGFITGLHKSPFHGFSVEFAEHRQYNTGEDTRHIDWKLYGRTDKLFVKRFEEETNLRCNILLDVSSSMFFPYRENINLEEPNKMLFSIFSAATLSELLFRQRDAVGLTSFSNEIIFHQDPKSSRVHLKNLYTYMEQLLQKKGEEQIGVTSGISETLHLMAEKIHKRSLIVIFSDMFDRGTDDTEALFSALQHLKFKNNEVLLFHVLDRKKELNFDYSNRPYRFIDMENNAEIKLNPAEIRSEYISKMNAYLKEIKLRCEQYKIDFVEADINAGYSQVLQTYLVKRQRMY
ncbi:MAG: DUF58 domain-containing protein [Bacteroidales bacterium]|jgi:uncharacterized protein (DUF58 family)|nr:DUF58 domain-containing protein [Bacteroidales bacterium]